MPFQNTKNQSHTRETVAWLSFFTGSSCHREHEPFVLSYIEKKPHRTCNDIRQQAKSLENQQEEGSKCFVSEEFTFKIWNFRFQARVEKGVEV